MICCKSTTCFRRQHISWVEKEQIWEEKIRVKQNNQSIFAVEQGQDQDQDQDQAKETSIYEKSKQKIKRELNKM